MLPHVFDLHFKIEQIERKITFICYFKNMLGGTSCTYMHKHEYIM